MEVLYVLCIVLVVMVVVGHGIWVALAWLLRGGRPRRDRAGYEPTQADDRAATARYLEHLRSRGLLDGDVHAQLMRLIAEDVHPVRTYLDKKRTLGEPTGPATPAAGTLKQRPVPRTLEPQPRPASTAPPPVSRGVGTGDVAVPARASLSGDRFAPASSPAPPSVDAAATSARFRPPREEPRPRPVEPRRPFSEVLVRFMAEKNIRWGELVGGLLILSCSTALVISLWSQIEAIPLLKFLIFTAVTAALFGVGLFVHHRWKLPTTGHALLAISSLLVPLNLVAFAAFSPPGPAIGGWTAGIELAAVALFGLLTLLAGRVIMSNAPALFACGVLTLSASSLVIRFVSPLTENGLLYAAMLPVGLYVIVMAVALWRESRGHEVSDPEANRVFLQLGVQTFASLVPLGLLFYGCGHAVRSMHLLSPLVCAIGVPALVTGLFLLRRLAPTALPRIRVTATIIVFVAAAVMLLGVAMAWPMPARLMPALLVNAVAMLAVSRLVSHPGVHAAVATWFGAAWVLGVHLVCGSVTWSTDAPQVVISALLSARTGQAIVGPVVACALLGAWLGRRHQYKSSLAYGVAALVLSVISVILITWYGFTMPGDAAHVTWVYVLYAAALFVATRPLKSEPACWWGCILLQAAIAQTLVYAWPLQQFAWPTSFLVGASACAAAVVVLKSIRVREEVARYHLGPLAQFALLISLAAAAWLALGLPSGSLPAFSIRIAWMSALLAALAIANVWPVAFAGAQLGFAVAACAAMQHHLQGLSWYPTHSSPWFEPWIWQAQLLVVGAMCLVWTVARIVFSRLCDAVSSNGESGWRGVGRRLLDPSFLATDRWMIGVALSALVLLSASAVCPSAIAEHGGELAPALVRPHAHALEIGSWVALTVVLVTLCLHLWEGFHLSAVPGILVVIVCATALIAGRYEAQRIVANMWRWLLASTFLVGSAALWTRQYWLEDVIHLVRFRSAREALHSGHVRLCIFGLFAIPALLLTGTFMAAVSNAWASLPAGASDAWLRFSLLGPAALVAACLIGYGVSERRPGFAIAAAALVCVVVTGVELCLLTRAGSRVSLELAVWLVQLNVIVSAAVPILWYAAQVVIVGRNDAVRYPTWPLIAGRVFMGAVLLLAVVAVWLDPGFVRRVAVAGSLWSFLAVLAVESALLITCQRLSRDQQGHRESVWVLFGAVLVGCALAPLDTGNWLCFHALMCSFVAAACVRLYAGDRQIRQLLGPGWQETFDAALAAASGRAEQIEHNLSCVKCGYNLRGLAPAGLCPECGGAIDASLKAATERLSPQRTGQLAQARLQAVGAVLACAVAGTLFAMRSAFDDPQRPWWSSAVLAALSALCMVLAGWASRRVLAYLGGIELCLAASVWWVVTHWRAVTSIAEKDLSNLVGVNVIALVVAGIAWLLVERRIVLRRSMAASIGQWPAFHCASAILSAAAVAVLAGAALYATAIGQPLDGVAFMSWLAWVAAAAIAIACYFDTAFRRHVAAVVYVLGLVGVVQAMAHSNMTPHMLTWAMSAGLAGYVFVTTLVWRRWARAEQETSGQVVKTSWLLCANAVLGSVSVVLAALVSLTHPEIAWRMLIVISPLLCAGSAQLAAMGRRRVDVQTCAVALLVAGGASFAWSWVSPDAAAAMLERAVGFVAVAVLAIASAGLVTRVTPGRWWAAAVTRCVVGTGVIGGIALLYCAGCEAMMLADQRAVPLPASAVAILIASLAVMIVCCILFATRDRFDPLDLKAGTKELYVYLAEALAGVLALHVRATMPWLFSGFIEQYWPLMVMALAFAAVGAGEICERYGQRVLARPFGRTGMFLPALAALELFIASSHVNYSVVLLTIGFLYALLAALRRSVVFSILAGVSFNGSLWYLLQHAPGLGIAQHPQLWFIPPSLAVLAATHVNRSRLTDEQRRAMHYACLLGVYLSSTADIFLIGVARAPWLPLVLMTLSVCGVLAGLASRVRSFLLLGTGFLCVSLLTMIWHAAVDLGWTWMWYVAGIALGAAIITMFALFEKKRNEMNALLQQVKNWGD